MKRGVERFPATYYYEKSVAARKRQKKELKAHREKCLVSFDSLFFEKASKLADKGYVDGRLAIKDILTHAKLDEFYDDRWISLCVKRMQERGFKAKYEDNRDNEYLPAIYVSWFIENKETHGPAQPA